MSVGEANAGNGAAGEGTEWVRESRCWVVKTWSETQRKPEHTNVVRLVPPRSTFFSCEGRGRGSPIHWGWGRRGHRSESPQAKI